MKKIFDFILYIFPLFVTIAVTIVIIFSIAQGCSALIDAERQKCNSIGRAIGMNTRYKFDACEIEVYPGVWLDVEDMSTWSIIENMPK